MITVLVIFFVFMSIVAHEVAHGYTAYRLGDSTAKEHGRLTLNLLKHVDLFGTIILPILMYFASGFIFGWARPVPVNPGNFKNPVRDFGIVGAAGPAANIAIVLILSVLVKSMLFFGWISASAPNFFLVIVYNIAYINILMALFNLIPLPPLDGSRMLFAVLPERLQEAQDMLEKYSIVGMFLAFGVVFYCFEYFQYATEQMLKVLLGL